MRKTVGDIFPRLTAPYARIELRAALRNGVYGEKVTARIAFACTRHQLAALRYLFADVKGVDWVEEVKQGRVIEWLRKAKN